MKCHYVNEEKFYALREYQVDEVPSISSMGCLKIEIIVPYDYLGFIVVFIWSYSLAVSALTLHN